MYVDMLRRCRVRPTISPCTNNSRQCIANSCKLCIQRGRIAKITIPFQHHTLHCHPAREGCKHIERLALDLMTVRIMIKSRFKNTTGHVHVKQSIERQALDKSICIHPDIASICKKI